MPRSDFPDDDSHGLKIPTHMKFRTPAALSVTQLYANSYLSKHSKMHFPRQEAYTEEHLF